MTVDLREVFSEVGKKIVIKAEVSISDFQYNGVMAVSEPISVSGSIYNRAGVICFDYNADFNFAAPCDRCADTVSSHYSQDYSHTIVTELLNEDNDDFDYIICPSMSLEIDDIVRDDILLDMPTKYLCSEDCKGLCVGCGKNLNVEDCTCEKEIDPRLAKLKDLLD